MENELDLGERTVMVTVLNTMFDTSSEEEQMSSTFNCDKMVTQILA
jgi:hypothetical protein